MCMFVIESLRAREFMGLIVFLCLLVCGFACLWVFDLVCLRVCGFVLVCVFERICMYL